MDKTIDLLQVKIENARAELSKESRDAIDAIKWKDVIIRMREERGYSFTQLETLEMETELLLCGLIEPENYPKELETRMGLPRAQVDELVNEMNDRVFKKIREELVKNIERNKTAETFPDNPLAFPLVRGKPFVSPDKGRSGGVGRQEGLSLESREEMLEKIQNVDLSVQKELEAPTKEEIEKEKTETPSILTQKLSGSFQIPKVETEHTLTNMTKDSSISTKPKVGIPNVDPYREIPS